jgi:ribonucleoside-diphosphate reductase alpha chain
VLVDKFVHTRFEPAGFTHNKEIPIAKSIADYIFRWLGLKFLPRGEEEQAIAKPEEKKAAPAPRPVDLTPRLKAHAAEHAAEHATYLNQADAPPCPTCGSIMVRGGACYKCVNCGATNGCS